MHFIEKKGQRLTVFSHLTSTGTGKPIEMPVTSQEQEAAMLKAEEIGMRGLGSILDPQRPRDSFVNRKYHYGMTRASC
jgi:hypothetical protein